MASLSEESHLAAKVKKETPILVILGNPPYSGHSANKGDWIKDQIETYKKVDGKPLGEKNPKWLQDDYVKFIRFAQWKIDQIGEGVLGFITNHSYLDNPTFRGMRQSLMNSFDEIYILDLHGNSLKKEKAPDGSKDENVFDIQQGVAIAIFVKKKRFDFSHRPELVEGQSTSPKILKHGEIWGDREHKYEWLTKHEMKKTDWKELKPVSPFYLFVPRDERLSRRFQSYPSIPAIFPVNSVGIVTARDHLTIHWTPHQVWTTVLNFVSLDPDIARQAYRLGNDARDWKVKLAQEDLRKSGPNKRNIVPILYRPFDVRYTYYTGNSRGFQCMPRGEVMQHMLQDNLAIILPRRVETAIPWSHVFASTHLVEHVAVSLKTIDYCFPLYLYGESGSAGSGGKSGFSRYQTMFVFEPAAAYSMRHPNISSNLLMSLSNAYKKQPTPEEVVHYIYAIVYSNMYRNKYAEFLKTDFPRVPFTKDYKLLGKLAQKGEQLVELHLLKSKKLSKPIARCEGSGDLRVEKVTYDQNKARVHINPEKWFTGIPLEVWEYQIGGYQVSEKWLKDRKSKGLSSEEVAHYARVVTAIAETISIQQSLDDLFPQVETNLLEVRL
jgi:predicted helicase